MGSSPPMAGSRQKTWRPLKLLPCAELGCCRIAPAACLIISERREEGMSLPLHLTASAFEFVFTCIRARLWKIRFDCSGGGVSLDGLGWIFPMQTSCPFRQRHITLQQTFVSDKCGIRLPATTDCFAGRINPVSTIRYACTESFHETIWKLTPTPTLSITRRTNILRRTNRNHQVRTR